MLLRFVCAACLCTVLSAFSCFASDGYTGKAMEAVERVFGYFPENVRFEEMEKSGEADVYSLSSGPHGLVVKGSSAVALCKGFHDYILENGYGLASWTGNRLDMPERLPRIEKTVVSPYLHHLYDNVCTFGYTYALWGWEQWEKEIDWMALHGFDMPLAPVAGEAVMARVWKKMGLTDKEISDYFCGPLHLPWQRMGNMSELDGGMSEEWFESQIALQHKINDRMLELGMTPVYQAFAGFVPEAFKRIYPDLELMATKWQGLKNFMLSPMDELFTRIGREYIREWEREFGKGKYYLIDSFNELEIPFGPKGSPQRYETLQKYSSTIYNTVNSVNPDAVWVMQGWMFGYDRHMWDPESVQALLSGAPKGRMIVIDLAVDFNEYVWQSENSWDYLDGFYGQEWIWSTVPNFGGRSALKGPVDFYLNGHLEALASPSRGALTGFGTSPEGVENNEVIYELISRAGWSAERTDTDRFLADYMRARYGRDAAGFRTFWKEMRQSVYNNFTNNARFRWQQRPAYHRGETMEINEHYYKGIEAFLSEHKNFKGNKLYEADAVQYAAFYLAGKADCVLKAADWAMVAGDNAKAAKLVRLLDTMLLDMDRLLESHPILRLERWLEFAGAAGTDDYEKYSFSKEAMRLVSSWGGPSLHDYSARIWSGLIRDYYAPRLREYFDAAQRGEAADMVAFEHGFHYGEGYGRSVEFHETDSYLSVCEPFANPVQAGIGLVEKYSGIDYENGSASVTDGHGGVIEKWNIHAPADEIAFWCPQDFAGKDKKRLYITMMAKDFVGMNGLKFSNVRSNDAAGDAAPVRISKIEFRSGKTNYLLRQDTDIVFDGTSEAEFAFKGPGVMDGLEREVIIYLTIEGNSYGMLSFY